MSKISLNLTVWHRRRCCHLPSASHTHRSPSPASAFQCTTADADRKEIRNTQIKEALNAKKPYRKHYITAHCLYRARGPYMNAIPSLFLCAIRYSIPGDPPRPPQATHRALPSRPYTLCSRIFIS